MKHHTLGLFICLLSFNGFCETESSSRDRDTEKAILACKAQVVAAGIVKKKSNPGYRYSDDLKRCNDDYLTEAFHMCVAKRIRAGIQESQAQASCANDASV